MLLKIIRPVVQKHKRYENQHDIGPPFSLIALNTLSWIVWHSLKMTTSGLFEEENCLLLP